jgi:transcription termination factor NusB
VIKREDFVRKLSGLCERTKFLQFFREAIVNSLEELDMTQNWNVYLPAFNARALAQLEICEHAVSRRLTVKEPEREVLDGLLHDIRENIQEVIDANIEEEVRQLLLEMLRAVERALLAYDISGLPGLRVTVERTIGVVILHSQRFEKSKEQGVVRRTFKTLGSVVSTLRNLEFVAQLPEKLRELLSLGE